MSRSRHTARADARKSKDELIEEIESLRRRLGELERMEGGERKGLLDPLTERLQQVYREAPTGLCYFDRNLQYVFINNCLAEFNGRSVEEHLGRSIREVIPGVAAGVEAQLRQVIETGEPIIGGEVDAETPAYPGLRRSFQYHYYAIKSEAGTVLGVACVVQEITARKHAEEALQLREQQFSDFAEASGDWFWEMDTEYRFTWLSDRVEDVTGVPAEFHIGKSRLELAGDRVEQDKWRAHLAALEARRPFRDFRYLKRGHDGRLQHMSSSGVPVFDAEGSFKGYRGTGTDISAEVKAEERAASAQKQFMAAIDSVSDGFALFDADDRMVFCNSRFKELNPDLAPKIVPGISFEEMLRDNIAANRILEVLDDEEAFIRERMAQHRNPTGPLVQQRRDGRWLELREERTPEGSTFLINTDITERKRMEEALREREAQLRGIMDNAPIEIVLKDTEGHYVLTNAQWQKSYNLTDEEAKGRTLHDFSPEEFAKPLSAHERELMETGEAAAHEDKFPQSDGVHDFLTITFPIRDTAGEVMNIGVMAVDITERKRAEAALRESEERLKLITNAVPAGISYFDREQRFRFANEKYESLLGLKPSDLVGKTLEQAIGKKPYEVARQYAQRALSGQTASFENTLHAKNGDMISIAVSYVPDIGPDRTVNGFFALVQDITERKRAEDELRESEARFKDFAEGANDWAWEMDSDFRYTYVSPSYEHYSGMPAESIIGHTRPELYAQVLPELEAQEVERWQEFNRLLEARQAFRSFEHRWVRPDGQIRYFLTSAKPVFDAQGRFVGYRGVGSDITDVRRRDEELREELQRRVEEQTAELRAAQAELLRQERLATLGQLIATVSHELRNPLGVIRTSAFVVREGLNRVPPRVERSLERIERNVVRCDRIIDEMLDFTRISELVPETTAIDDWLAGVLKEQSLPRGITLLHEFGLPGTHIGVERDRLRRAVINVFDNACQAMIADGNERTENGEHRLTVRTGAAAGRIELVFEDTGPGIPPEVLPKVFEPLFSTKNFGVGLGLSVVHQIMEQHGGGVEIENIVGGGVRVCLWLPGGEPGP